MRPLRILHLEDDPVAAELLRAMLESDGIICRVRRVDAEKEYAEALEQGPYDLILSDFSLPSFDGLSALKLAREKAPHTPYIFVSGAIGEERAIESLKQGATDYILKDRLSRFVPAVRRAIREQEEKDKRVLAEEEALKKEQRFRSIVETTQEWIWEIDAEGISTYNNPGFETMLGYPSTAILGKDIIQLVQEEDRMRARDILQSSVKNKKGWYAIVLRWKRSDGTHRWLESNAVPIFDNDGSVVGFRGSDRDITDRKNSEDTIREQAALLDVDPDAIIVRDLEGKILFWNQGAERMFGWRAPEVVGTIGSGLWPQKVIHIIEEARTAVLKNGSWSGELQETTKTGTEITVESRWTLVKDEQGQPKAVYMVDTDITEKKMLQTQFLRAQRMEGIGTLAGGIAHDLNNVLGPILLSLEVMRGKVHDPSLLRMIDTIESSGRRGADLIKQVLSFARGVHGEHVTVQIRHLIGEVESIMKETFPKSMAVAIKAPKNLWTVSGDATQLHQVLMNLCVNARDAMPNGGRLELKCENIELDQQYGATHIEAKLGRYVCLSVTDTGIGIPPEIKAKIFDPFYTTKEIGKGTGLGLSTVLTIVKSHDGFINVYSEPGKGATFRVYLPVRASDVPEELKVREESVAGKGELILVVDDEESVREITRTTLEAFGYAVVTANDGTDAVSKYALEKDRISLVVTDMMMPYMDGPATIRALRKMNPNVTILAVSGLGHDGQFAEGDVGIAFLHKPYTAQKLLASIRTLLDSK